MSYQRKKVHKRYEIEQDTLVLPKDLIDKLSEALRTVCEKEGTIIPKGLKINRINLSIVDHGIIPHAEFYVEEEK